MLLAMDHDIQRWLEECKMFKEREDVNDRILDDLPNIIRDVCRGSFIFDLPPVFNGKSMPEDEPHSPPYKRRKIEHNIPEDNKRRKVVQNPTPNTEYKLRDGEEYSKLLGGHQNACHRVDWPGGKNVPPFPFQDVLLR